MSKIYVIICVDMIMRLDKLVCELSNFSRKEARKLIMTGAVSYNGEIISKIDTKVVAENAEVKINGMSYCFKKFRYFMLNKPMGVISATEDSTQKTVLDLLPNDINKKQLAPVGRLDKDTTGLLVITDNGDYAHKVISPKSDIKKVYYAETDGTPTMADIELFKTGIELRDGTKCLPAKLEVLGENRCLVTVCEGKYHQVKRMLAAVNCTVLRLRRLSIGMLHIDEKLVFGEVREMNEAEANLVFSEIIDR